MKRVALLLLLSSAAHAATVPAAMPQRYEAVSSVILQYRWFKFPALGVMSVDARKHNFALAGLSQLGVSVFELSEKNGVIKSRMPGKLLMRKPQIASSAAADVGNMFFDLTPPPAAIETAGSGPVAIYTQATPHGTLEYRIDRATRRIVEKRFSVPRSWLPGSTAVWTVCYENYATKGKATYPQTVRFKQRQLHYAITTFVKEMRIK